MTQELEELKDIESLVLARVIEQPSVMPRSLAQELNTTEGNIIAALPSHMRIEVPSSDFVSIWEEMTTWAKVTFLAENVASILEIAGVLPKGKLFHGMYNLMDKNYPLGGHLLIEKIAKIWLVSKPAFKLESHSVQFFTKDGLQCFAVYLGRDAEKNIIPSVKDGYMKLWQKYSKQ